MIGLYANDVGAGRQGRDGRVGGVHRAHAQRGDDGYVAGAGSGNIRRLLFAGDSGGKCDDVPAVRGERLSQRPRRSDSNHAKNDRKSYRPPRSAQ